MQAPNEALRRLREFETRLMQAYEDEPSEALLQDIANTRCLMMLASIGAVRVKPTVEGS